MVTILAFYDASFGWYAADRRTYLQTDRISKINTSLVLGRAENKFALVEF